MRKYKHSVYQKLTDDTFIGVNSKGNKKIYYKLAEFDLKETNKNYLIYTDNERFEDGRLKIFAAIVTQENDLLYFENIETDREWACIGSVINIIRQELEK